MEINSSPAIPPECYVCRCVVVPFNARCVYVCTGWEREAPRTMWIISIRCFDIADTWCSKPFASDEEDEWEREKFFIKTTWCRRWIEQFTAWITITHKYKSGGISTLGRSSRRWLLWAQHSFTVATQPILTFITTLMQWWKSFHSQPDRSGAAQRNSPSETLKIYFCWASPKKNTKMGEKIPKMHIQNANTNHV